MQASSGYIVCQLKRGSIKRFFLQYMPITLACMYMYIFILMQTKKLIKWTHLKHEENPTKHTCTKLLDICTSTSLERSISSTCFNVSVATEVVNNWDGEHNISVSTLSLARGIESVTIMVWSAEFFGPHVHAWLMVDLELFKAPSHLWTLTKYNYNLICAL